MFWFKKKKIVLDCFTSDPFAHDYAPISSAINFYPEWWKKMDPHFNIRTKDREDKYVSTMKSCRGFIDLYKSSFVIPYWGNIGLEVGDINERNFEWHSNFDVEHLFGMSNVAEEHNPRQFAGFVERNFQHIKLPCPWYFKTNKYVKFLLSDPVWNKSNLTDYNVLPGVIDFKYQRAANINMMIEYKNTQRTIRFEPNDVIAMLTPITEEHVEIKHHLVPQSEIERKFAFSRSFFERYSINGKKYSTNKKFIDECDERNKPKCPFGFGK